MSELDQKRDLTNPIDAEKTKAELKSAMNIARSSVSSGGATIFRAFVLILIIGIIGLMIYATVFVPNSKERETDTTSAVISKDDTKLSDITHVDGKVNVYVFHGSTCPHCSDLFDFFAALSSEQKAKMQIYGFETWESQENVELIRGITSFLDGKSSTSVPYVVIGDKSIVGFGSGTGTEILTTVNDYLNSNDTYDVFEEYQKSRQE